MSEAETSEGLRSRRREMIQTPAWREARPRRAQDACKMGEAVLDGAANLGALECRSLAPRGKLP
jgi:hypothetical protein